jgi:hypothetical protein
MRATTKVVLHSPAKEFEAHQVDLFGELPEVGHNIKIGGRRYPIVVIEWSEQEVNGTLYLSPIIVVGRQVV